ncbi:uncharacterized protein LY89DRAFT_663947 [Mollisia scopiformis]|uniref:Uncharacterized protein n=1 Tax=Mollisia scopiformis TaxID=149040 RepID=A0A194XTR2_MOLSC|nr:uncharacterized protein LY89DRAFT_663947 [Mollisia scopiformis]KUJ23531.1 hypothetical protein LY89DRAFT_663947 [Mollisia scopiformis]
MQSSVRSEPPPHLGDLPRTFSNDSVHISKEVSVTSSRVPTPPVQRSMYSPMPPSLVQRPASAISRPFSISAGQVTRWNSMSKNSEKSSLFQMRTEMGRRRSSVDPDLLESNRESMKALSDFLMTREPPPTNWVSAQSSDDDKSLNSFKRSAYKLFGKSKKKKKSKQQKLLRLPDSAVAARTSRGARHIAISIPLVHDHMEFVRSDTPTPETRMGKRERTDRAAVHVLKPLHELRESGSIHITSPPRSSNGPVIVIPEFSINPLASHPPDEALRQSPTLGGTYLNYRPQPRIEPSNAPKHDPKRPSKSYVAVSPTAMQRADSQRSADPRHSGGTVYSTISIATPNVGHSRQVSSVSTAPSATATSIAIIPGLKLDLPPRNSSMSKIAKPIQAELAQSSNTNDLPSPPNSPLKPGDESLSSNSPPLVVVGTAEMVRKYSDGPTLVRSTTPRSSRLTTSSPPPNKCLPDLPIGKRPRISPPTTEKKPSARRERVKEKKQRDIEALRSSKSSISRPPLSESKDTNTNTNTYLTTPPQRNPKRVLRHSSRTANVLSGVMIVADLPPSPSPSLHTKQSSSTTTTTMTATRQHTHAHTPPRSPTLDDFPAIPDHFSSRSSSLTPTTSPTFRKRGGSLRNSVLETRRAERRVKRNASLRERELDERVRRIERDNEVLIGMLGGIAGALGGLRELQGRREVRRLRGGEGVAEEEEGEGRDWLGV